MLGYNKMLEVIKPSVVICYDEPFEQMKGNIVTFLPTTYEWTKGLDWKNLAQFRWGKQNRNVSGLNKNDFKFFDYDDPLVQDIMVKCSICGKVALQDEWGNGECKNCGWKFCKYEEIFEKEMGISYPLLVSPTTARWQYKNGLPFKATFEEFVNGLYFYSEMLLKHNNIMYEVFLKGDNDVVFCCENMIQTFSSRDDFIQNANIDGKLLKDIWDEVTFAGFMYCG